MVFIFESKNFKIREAHKLWAPSAPHRSRAQASGFLAFPHTEATNRELGPKELKPHIRTVAQPSSAGDLRQLLKITELRPESEK